MSDKMGWLKWFQIAIWVIVIAIIAAMFLLGYSGGPITDVNYSDGLYYSDELYYSETDEAHIAFDPSNGLQFADNELIIHANDWVSRQQMENLVSADNGAIVGYLQPTNTYQIRFNRQYTYNELTVMEENLSHSGFVRCSSLNLIIDLSPSAHYPTDEKVNGKWNKNDDKTWGLEAIKAPAAWDYIDIMEDARIGIWDSAFFVEHEDLNFAETPLGNVELTEKADVAHGTHVAGIAAATHDEKTGIVGVAPKTQLYGYAEYGVRTSSMGDCVALCYLIGMKKCNVINISMSADQLTFAASRGNALAQYELTSYNNTISDFLEILLDNENNFVICKSAGNQDAENSNYQYVEVDFDMYDSKTFYGYISRKEFDENKEQYAREPQQEYICGDVLAQYDIFSGITNPRVKDRIIVVGAAKRSENGYAVDEMTNHGDRIDLIAPGDKIYSTLDGKSKYGDLDGTSMASPYVAGVAAMMFAVNPDIDGAKVKEIIVNAAIRQYEDRHGYRYGFLDAELAVKIAVNLKEAAEDVDDTPDTEVDNTQDPDNQQYGYLRSSELVVNGVSAETTPEELVELLGQPDNMLEETIGDGVYIFYTYDYGDVTYDVVFDGDTIFIDCIRVTGKTDQTPRNIQVGDRFEDVLGKFPQDKDYKQSSDGSFYGVVRHGDTNFGDVHKEDDRVVITLVGEKPWPFMKVYFKNDIVEEIVITLTSFMP